MFQIWAPVTPVTPVTNSNIARFRGDGSAHARWLPQVGKSSSSSNYFPREPPTLGRKGFSPAPAEFPIPNRAESKPAFPSRSCRAIEIQLGGSVMIGVMCMAKPFVILSIGTRTRGKSEH
eukprot:scaffold52250_cov80-Phaeocystis_antarctica.AAC.2